MIIANRHRIFMSTKRLTRWGFPPSCRVAVKENENGITVSLDEGGLWSISQDRQGAGSRLVLGRQLLEDLGWRTGDSVKFKNPRVGVIEIQKVG